jgi:polyphosphate kinase
MATPAGPSRQSVPNRRSRPGRALPGGRKKRARLESMRNLLAGFDYDGKDHQAVGDPDLLIVGAPTISLNEYDEEYLSPTPIAGTGS